MPQISDKPSSECRVPLLGLLKSTSNFSVEEGGQLQPLPGVSAGDQSPPATDSLSDPPVVGGQCDASLVAGVQCFAATPLNCWCLL